MGLQKNNPTKKGRPTDYKPSYNKQVYKLCLLGHTDAEIAQFFLISESTLNLWKLKHPKFSESIKKGKEISDSEVVEKLYKRATGYKYKETSYEKIDSKQNLEVTPDSLITTDAYKKKVTVKELAPDTTAQIFWLKNRQPKQWRDKQDIEVSGKNGKPIETKNTVIDYSKLSEETLREILQATKA